MKKTDSDSASSTIDAYRKRQQRGPMIIWIVAALLVIIGIIIIVVWLTGDNKPEISLFSTETPTPTLTYTPTVTASPTATATMTLTPTMTFTPTPSAPFSYLIQENESFATISEKFNLGEDGILLLLALNPDAATRGFVFVGEEVLIPNPGMQLPTATPVPFDLPRGTELQYTILPGDTIAAIAAKFRSTEDAVIEANELEDANAIQVGQILVVPANLVTAVPTRLPPTAPADATATPAPVATATKASTSGGTTSQADCAYKTNENYPAQIFDRVNNERVAQGLDPLEENSTLTAVAQAHAADMACNNFWKVVGSDGSTVTDRLMAAGYKAVFANIKVHAQPPEYGGDGEAAVKAWLEADDILLDPDATEFGVAYAYYRESSYGGYFTIVLAAPAP